LVVDEPERPILAHRVTVAQGDAPDVLELHVEITNRGTAASGESRLQLQHPEAGIAELLEGTTTFTPIAPGATVDTRLHVKLLTSTVEVPTVNLLIFDAEYRSLVDSKVRLAESEGRWLEPPRISLSRFENRQGADGASHAIVAAVTDDTGIAQVRASVDGDRLLFLDMSGRPLTEQSVSLPWATSSETKRYEIIATDTDGLVARYVTDL
jgi:hypothetical protein